MLVEDDTCLLDCLEAEIGRAAGLRCVGGYTSFEKAKKAIANKIPDVILLDLGLPGMDGVGATGLIHKEWPRIKIVIFSGNSSDESIYSAFMAGANGFLLKSSPSAELVAGIECAYEGGSPISPGVASALICFFHRRQLLIPNLSPTEQAILQEFDRGVPQKQIEQKLQISHSTLRTHVGRILEKTGAASLWRAAYLRRHVIR
jgi:DNA-binding NarL/FixJ family response regulator